MSRNVGSLDKVVRFVIGLGLIALVVTGPRVLWGLLGLIPIVTGMAGVCPLYSAVGISTRREEEPNPTGGLLHL